MANKKVTITISDDAFSKLENQANILDITVNTLIKQISMNYITNNKIEFITSEQRIVLQDFQKNQAKLITILNQISTQYLSKGIKFPIDQAIKYLKNYNEHFKTCVQGLSHDN